MKANSTPDFVRSPSLELLGAFALVQVMCDDLFEAYFAERTPEAMKFIKDRALSRISDGERLSLMVRIAKASDAASFADRFREVYDQVKDVRDGIAHGYIVDEVVYTEPQWLVAGAEGKRRGVQHPEEVRTEFISLMARHCEWLQNVVVQVGLDVGAIDTYQVPEPPSANPPGWKTVERVALNPSTSSIEVRGTVSGIVE